MEYEEAKEKIVEELTKKFKSKSKFYFNDLAEILEDETQGCQKNHQSIGAGRCSGILVKRQHFHVRSARNRKTGSSRTRRIIRATLDVLVSGHKPQLKAVCRTGVAGARMGSGRLLFPHFVAGPEKRLFPSALLRPWQKKEYQSPPLKKDRIILMRAGWPMLPAGPAIIWTPLSFPKTRSSLHSDNTPPPEPLPLSKATGDFMTASM